MKEDAAAWERLQLVLEWVLDVKLRQPEALHFTMTYISFGDKSALGNRYGAAVALQMLLQLAKDLRREMRKSDIVGRDGTDFWVLIPHIGAEQVIPKVSKIIEIASANGLDVVNRDVSMFTFQDNAILKQNSLYSPLKFLEYVKANRSVARSWSVETS